MQGLSCTPSTSIADIFDDFSSFHEVVLLAYTVAELNAYIRTDQKYRADAAEAVKAAKAAKAAMAVNAAKAVAIKTIPASAPSACIPSAPPLSAIALYRIRARKLPR